MPMPIERYYRVHSTSDRPLVEMVGRVLSILSMSGRTRPQATDERPVVFVSGPFATTDEMYVSAGALAMLSAANVAIRHEQSSMPLPELPGDLMMLRGDACDGDAYGRHKNSLMESSSRHG